VQFRTPRWGSSIPLASAKDFAFGFFTDFVFANSGRTEIKGLATRCFACLRIGFPARQQTAGWAKFFRAYGAGEWTVGKVVVWEQESE
jgi:hypothetical protein